MGDRRLGLSSACQPWRANAPALGRFDPGQFGTRPPALHRTGARPARLLRVTTCPLRRSAAEVPGQVLSSTASMLRHPATSCPRPLQSPSSVRAAICCARHPSDCSSASRVSSCAPPLWSSAASILGRCGRRFGRQSLRSSVASVVGRSGFGTEL
jgi:hypothetical protein